MAVSPCPKCQDKETFDDLTDDTSCERPGFVIQKTPRQDGGPEFFCTTKPEDHQWTGIDSLAKELRKAGYR